LIILSNDFKLPAELIVLLYHRGWHIEQFFRWIKQNLRFKVSPYCGRENVFKSTTY